MNDCCYDTAFHRTIREKICNAISTNGIESTNFHLQMLKDLNDERYVAANFTGYGKTSKAFEHIAAEVAAQASNVKKIQTCFQL